MVGTELVDCKRQMASLAAENGCEMRSHTGGCSGPDYGGHTALLVEISGRLLELDGLDHAVGDLQVRGKLPWAAIVTPDLRLGGACLVHGAIDAAYPDGLSDGFSRGRLTAFLQYGLEWITDLDQGGAASQDVRGSGSGQSHGGQTKGQDEKEARHTE